MGTNIKNQSIHACELNHFSWFFSNKTEIMKYIFSDISVNLDGFMTIMKQN
jgi:hypothetical protein